MMRTLHEARDEEGFTLIELLVVVIIIGILAAIAIPVFLNQREKAYVRSAESDARNAAIEIESYFAEFNKYPADFTITVAASAGTGDLDGVRTSDGVALFFDVDDTTKQTFDIYTCHELVDTDCANVGSGANQYTSHYDSDAGGIQ